MMLHRSSLLVVLIASGSLAACAGGEDGAMERGDAIEALLQDRIAGLVEEVRIDGNEGDLVAIRGLLVADDGTVIVSQPQQASVRFFGPAGEALGAVGSRGQGPGEFTFLGDIGWLGDTVWVHDPAQGRLTFVSPDREVVGTRRVPSEVSASGELVELAGATFLPLGVGPDGSQYSRPFGVLPGAFRDSMILVRGSPDGTIERIVVRVPQGQVVVPTSSGAAPVPFPNPGLLAASRSADRFVGVSASLDGPEMFPPFDGFRLDEDGRSWIAMRPQGGERRHLVVDAEGQPKGMLMVPRRGRVAAARGDRIWVIEQDDLDVESVVRYSVEWR